MKVLLGKALRETTGSVESPPRLVSPDSGARRQRAVASPEDAAGEHPLSRLGRSASPVDRQHRDQGRGRRRVERPQARRSQTPGLAQAPHGHRRDILGTPGGRVHRQRRGRCTDAARTAGPDTSQQKIATDTADDAVDTRKGHDAIAARGAAAIIPPHRNAKPGKPDTGGSVARNQILRTSKCRGQNHLATMERLSAPKPRIYQDALCETARTRPERMRLRPSDRRVPSQGHRAQRLHCPRHAHHRGRGVGLSGRRERPVSSRFVQRRPVAMEIRTDHQRH